MPGNVKRGLFATLIATLVTAFASVPVDALWRATCGEAWIGPNGVNAHPPVELVLRECLPLPRPGFLAVVLLVTLALTAAALGLRAGPAASRSLPRSSRLLGAAALIVGLVSVASVATSAYLHGPVIESRLGLNCRSLHGIVPDSPLCPPTFEENLIATMAWAMVAGVAFLLVVGARSLVTRRPPARALTLVSQALIVMAIAALAVSYGIVFVANWGTHVGRLLPLVERALT